MGLEYKKEGSIATFTIANGSVNPLTPLMHKELYLAIRDFIADDRMRCGILTGAGEKAFCAGDDIKTNYKSVHSPEEQLADHLWPHRREGDTPETFAWSRDVLMLERFKPIIGAINGWCLGQGMIYLLHLTDLRIASTTAKFGFPEIAYGMGGAGGTTRLGRQIPHSVAMWMLLTGEPMSAEQALEFHLVNKVVEPDELMKTALQTAEIVAGHDPIGVRIEMEAYYRCMDLSRLDAVALTKHLYRMQRLGLSQNNGESIGEGKFLYSNK
ncbi:enoyl-CoA hydratase/isomerase family protein [Rhodoligotrophos ferricapiens]|uniref:enoyl-CoA hydratase/isomerase family protein n=1 Tax=Rhodoligotrophos ferricapiens TaxID=3069264 RepID=UPI00315C5AC9